MRDFSFHSAACLRLLATAGGLALGSLVGAAAEAAAQWPAELLVTVVDAASGHPISGAAVTVVSSGASAQTQSDGSVRLRGLDAGGRSVTVDALGFLSRELRIDLRNGQRRAWTVELTPDPMALAGLRVQALQGRSAGVHVFDRAHLDRSGIRTLGELAASVPGVVVRQDQLGGRQEISIRGSSADAVLVLVDGAPLNDPVSGVADLSLIRLSDVASVRVIPGAQSARYGPRALAGVVEVLGRDTGSRSAVEAYAGSLGLRGGALSVAGGDAESGQRLSVEVQRVDGGFDFERPVEVGGGADVRTNADAAFWEASGSGHRTVGRHRLGARVAIAQSHRGLPGKAFQQADSSRQDMKRIKASLTWSLPGTHDWKGLISAVSQEVRFHDPAPPLGRPFDDHTRFFQTTARLEGSRRLIAGDGPLLGYGVEVEHLGVDASALAAAEARASATHAGGHVRTEWRPSRHWLLAAAARLDGGGGIATTFSHSVSVGVSSGGASATLAHKSAFSPPTLGDQFFREGVGVRANPELGPERVPSEWSLTGALHTGPLGLGGTAYSGDVRGMIVWLPDFQFIWSPRNTNVRRRGLDLWADWDPLPAAVKLRARYSFARITYDRDGDDSVQLAYRPRHTGGVDADWSRGPWLLAVKGDFTGTRYPVPAAINALEAFWSWRLTLARQWSASGWNGELRLHVDRVLGRRNTLIFGFPSPGRTVRLTARFGL